MSDQVNHPEHYITGGIETIDIMRAKLPREAFIGYLHGNVVKYTLRANFKGSFQTDLEKARWYLNYLIQFTSAPEGTEAK